MCESTTGGKVAVEIGIGRTVGMSFEAAIAGIEAALQKEGFGVLTRIDVKETLKQKLGVEGSPYVILGACNPPLAHQALGREPQVGLLLPCNVVVREIGPGRIRVEAMNPEAMVDLFPGAGLQEIAAEARRRLEKAIEGFDAPGREAR